MNYRELMEQPDNVVFYEKDIMSPALLQKVETLRDDVIAREFDADFEVSRIGFREMDEVIRNSKQFHVFSCEELESLNSYIALAYLQEQSK